MRFALAFVAILVVSLASYGESNRFEEYTGSAQSVKELKAVFESSRIVNPKPDNNDEIVTAAGAKTSVKELITSYELFQRSGTLQRTEKGGLLPSVDEFAAAIKNGKKFDLNSAVCKFGAGKNGKPKKEWYEFLCF